MREIEFRGKREDNGEWVHGYLVQAWDGTCYIITEYGPNVTSCSDCGANYMLDHEVIPETVGQYTGLNDKNGQKIYEGDIVFVTDSEGNSGMCDTGVGEVESFEGLWYICGNVQNGLYDISKNFVIEVIGNIYDNQELLQEVER